MNDSLGEGLGCGLMFIGFGICFALITWALSGFPGLR